MNCDDAFDLMTSEKPASAPMTALDNHLKECPRCRAMQETLSPVIDWLCTEEFTSKTLHPRTPQAPQFLSQEAVLVAERAALRLATRHAGKARRDVRRTARTVLLFAGLAALFCIAFLPTMKDSLTTENAKSPLSSAKTVCLWKAVLDDESQSFPTADQLVASCAACHLASK